VLLWRLQGLVGAGSLAATLAGSRGPVRALAFTPGGTELVTGGDDATVRVWDARPDQQLDLLGRAPGAALAARWTGGTIVGLWHSVVKTYDARTRRVTHVLHGEPGTKFTSLGVSSDGSVVAAGGADGTTTVWDGRTGDRVAALAGPTAVSALAVSPRGDLVASGDARGTVRVWRGKRLLWSAQQAGPVAAVAFSPGGDRLVTSGRRGAVVWSAAGGRRLHDPLTGRRRRFGVLAGRRARGDGGRRRQRAAVVRSDGKSVPGAARTHEAVDRRGVQR